MREETIEEQINIQICKFYEGMTNLENRFNSETQRCDEYEDAIKAHETYHENIHKLIKETKLNIQELNNQLIK